MQTRMADTPDLTVLAGLFDSYRQSYRQESDLEGAAEFIRQRLSRSDSTIFVVSDGGIPVGFTQLYPSFSSVSMRPIYILNDLFVSSEARRRGAASALLKAAEVFATKRNASRLTLATEVTNTSAQSLYEKLGWQKNDTFFYYNRNL